MKIEITYEYDNRFIFTNPYWAKCEVNGQYKACCGDSWATAKARLLNEIFNEDKSIVPPPETLEWGGKLLGWAKPEEVAALEESIKHDY